MSAAPSVRRAPRSRSEKRQRAPDVLPVVKVDLASLKDHPRNYRRHPSDQVDEIVALMRECGVYKNIVTARDGTVLAGHATVLAARKAGLTSLSVVRLPIEPNDPRAWKVLAGDNEISKMADVDDRALADLLKDVMGQEPAALLGTGYDQRRLANLAFVTRPMAEIATIDAAAQWAGMPEYDDGDRPITLHVHFRSPEARQRFMKLVGFEPIHVTKNGSWWPAEPRMDLTSVRFQSAPGKKKLPRYPVYVPSKARWSNPLTVRALQADAVPFRLVVEPQDAEQYRAIPGVAPDQVLVLPFRDQGLHAARSWIKDHSVAEGAARHWQLDDNIRRFGRRYRAVRIPCAAGPALAVVEDFIDRYSNVALAGLEYWNWAFGHSERPPFVVNSWVYSCTLVNNAAPHRWRTALNDDTDICLQSLADGWCTVRVTAFLQDKMATMTMGGGNTDAFYRGDGRLRMARALERLWPGVAGTTRRFRRPQHYVDWTKFDTPLRFRRGYRLPTGPDEHGLVMVATREVKHPLLRELLARAGGAA